MSNQLKKGITFYLTSEKDIQLYITFKRLIKENDDYESISDYFRKQFKNYTKKNI